MFDPALCLDLIAQHRVTIFLPVPTMLASLVVEQRATATRRVVAATARPRRFADRAGADPSGARGLSRHRARPVLRCHRDLVGGHAAASRGSDDRYRPRRIVRPAGGRASPSERVRPDGTDCEPGEVGEVWRVPTRSPVGYWRQRAATADALRDGWYHTGDLGYLNDRNYLFVVDRAKDMIVSGAENVYSVEVEDALYRHPCRRRSGGVRRAGRDVGRGRARDRRAAPRNAR